MYKRKYTSILALAVVSLLLAMCSKSNENGPYYSVNIDMSKSSLSAHRTQTTYYFSKDNGTTFNPGEILNPGEKYKVRVFDSKANLYLTNANFFTLDWSASTPKASSASSDTPEFVMGGSNTITVSIIDTHCPLDAASWTGAWGGDEVGACCGGTDANTIRQDGVNPNKLIMNNFWGDGVDAYFILSPSTSWADQTLTLPTQTTSEGGVASGTGTYDQCRGTFTIATKYVIGGSTYNWQYNFHR